ncbi:hypothetical protein ACQ4PT_027648 [Festuca glaucescens]
MDIHSSIWKVSYSTKKDLDCGRMKAYDGTMKFWSSNGWIVLLNAKDEPIAVQVIPLGQCFKPGTKVTFPHHVVRVGCTLYGSSAILENPPVEALVLAPVNMVGSTSADGDRGKHSGNLHELDSAAESVQNNLDPSFVVHTSIAMGLDFKAGYNFAKEWTLVSPSKQRAKVGMDALNLPAPKPALKHNSSINKKLVFAETIHYEARKGYAAVGSSSTNLNMYQTETTPVISFGTTFPITKGQEQVADKVQSSTIPVSENQVIKQPQKPDDMTQKTTNIPIADQAEESSISASAGPDKGQSPPHCALPPSTSVAPSPPMANFEVDPTPWLPWGHQVIDGGPTILPRSFYFATQDPPQERQNDCIGIVNPAPPPNLQAFWRHQVRNFLVGPLNRNVVDYQPSLYGVGLYQFSGPTAVSALIQHGEYNINDNMTVRFIPVDHAVNHRAEQGFRKGWLMFVGMNPDYRNDLDIANAVSTFGKFHYWNHTDPILERVLVYDAFPSPSLVPRDVVFGRFASVGGVKDSWTIPLFILTAEFADVLPADEDPMPPDGNLHPMPGNMQQCDNLFVPPQFPKIGWNMVPMEQGPMGQHNHQHDDMQQQDLQEEVQQQIQEFDQDIEEAESMVLVPSDSSGDSSNMVQDNHIVVQYMHHLESPVLPQQLMDRVVFGPIIPPEMQWTKIFEHMMPQLLSASIPLSLQLSPFIQLKRSWSIAFAVENLCDLPAPKVLSVISKQRLKCSPRRRSVARQLLYEEKTEGNSNLPIVFAATPVSVKTKRARKAAAPIVLPEDRCFTRSCLKDGYRPTPVVDVQPNKKGRGRAKLLVVQKEPVESGSTDIPEQNNPSMEEGDFIRSLATPIHVLQRIGRQLGIAEEKLTKEKLEAAPDSVGKAKSDDV